MAFGSACSGFPWRDLTKSRETRIAPHRAKPPGEMNHREVNRLTNRIMNAFFLLCGMEHFWSSPQTWVSRAFVFLLFNSSVVRENGERRSVRCAHAQHADTDQSPWSCKSWQELYTHRQTHKNNARTHAHRHAHTDAHTHARTDTRSHTQT